MQRSPVNVYTEWGPLEEVIVGEFHNYTVPARIDDVDISFRSFYHDNIFRDVQAFRRYRLNVYASDVRKYPEQIEEEREEDVNAMAAILTSLGIEVKRPRRLETIREIVTSDWVNVASPCGNVRDQFLVLGDEIIETSPMMRSRYFENDLLKHHLLDYFKRGARWTVAPRPRMIESSFDRSYFDENPPNFDPNQFEIMFDGAQCLKFGRDIVFNVANENHILGAIWLQRHLGERFRVHQVRVTDSHIDGMFLPLRPGTILMHRHMGERMERLPKGLQNWDTIVFDDDHTPSTQDEELLLASASINMNVFSIDSERVLINEAAVNTIRALERAGFVPIPVRLRHSRLYSGAFHCSTLDIRRSEAIESYF